MNYKEKKRRQAFIDEIKAVEVKHGYRLNYYQPPVQAVILPIQKPKGDEHGQETPASKAPWWKRLFVNVK